MLVLFNVKTTISDLQLGVSVSTLAVAMNPAWLARQRNKARYQGSRVGTPQSGTIALSLSKRSDLSGATWLSRLMFNGNAISI